MEHSSDGFGGRGGDRERVQALFCFLFFLFFENQKEEEKRESLKLKSNHTGRVQSRKSSADRLSQSSRRFSCCGGGAPAALQRRSLRVTLSPLHKPYPFPICALSLDFSFFFCLVLVCVSVRRLKRRRAAFPPNQFQNINMYINIEKKC